MKKLIIILFSLVAMASLVVLISRNPQKPATEKHPVTAFADTLLHPGQDVVLNEIK
ncbi:MAG: hypothetical protein AB8F95_08245 [Bacteroidia bacterium]